MSKTVKFIVLGYLAGSAYYLYRDLTYGDQSESVLIKLVNTAIWPYAVFKTGFPKAG